MSEEFISKVIPVVLLLVIGIIEAAGGLYLEGKRTKDDYAIEIVSTLILPTLVQPLIFIITLLICSSLFSGYENHLIELNIGIQFLSFLIFDDMMQYWWHRLSHSNKAMWKLHRPHHVIEEMGVLVTYRNALMYYAFMPGIWFSAVLVFLGMGYAYLFYLPIKLIVILLAHSETKWDRILYKYKFLYPLAWIIERTISTPSTHFAHHGLSASDGISHPNGNFGNLLFIWDIIFGTSKITRKYPTTFGAWNQIKEPWHIQWLFPIVKSKNPKSELYSIKSPMDYDPTEDYSNFEINTSSEAKG